MRKGYLALAAFAVLSVLAQPVCAAFELRVPAFHSAAAAQPTHGGTDSGESTVCCAEAEGPVLTPLSAAGKTRAALAAPQATAPARALTPSAMFALRALKLSASGLPPPRLSYYARSARILR